MRRTTLLLAVVMVAFAILAVTARYEEHAAAPTSPASWTPIPAPEPGFDYYVWSGLADTARIGAPVCLRRP